LSLKLKIKIIERYILSVYIPIFFLISLIFLVFFVVGDLVDISKMVISNSINFATIAEYFWHIIPFYYVKYIMPISNLLAVFMAIGLLTRSNEIIAMRASGLSSFCIFKPIIIFSLALVAVSLYLSLEYVPTHKRHSQDVKTYKIKMRERTAGTVYDLFLNIRKDYAITGAAFHYDLKSQIKIDRIIITRYGDNKVLKRWDADECRYENNRWILYNCAIREWPGGVEKLTQLDRYDLTEKLYFSETPEDIYALYNIQNKDKDEFTYYELVKYSRLLAKSGFSPEWALTDLYYLFSFPLCNLILVLFGLPIAVHSSKTNIAYGFGLSLMIAFAFWVCTYICIAFGHRAILPPLLAANLTNILFLSLSGIIAGYLKNRII